MTKNNAAQVAEQAIKAAIRKAYDDGYNDAKMAPDNCSTYCVERAVRLDSAALLSALRAPVADERAAFEAHRKSLGLCVKPLHGHPGLYENQAANGGWTAWQARAALASAPAEVKRQKVCVHFGKIGSVGSFPVDEGWVTIPDATMRDLADRMQVRASTPVAGEAQPVCWIEKDVLESVRDEGSDAWVYWRPAGHVAEPDEMPLYAAPQASEASIPGMREAARLLRERASDLENCICADDSKADARALRTTAHHLRRVARACEQRHHLDTRPTEPDNGGPDVKPGEM